MMVCVSSNGYCCSIWDVIWLSVVVGYSVVVLFVLERLMCIVVCCLCVMMVDMCVCIFM